MAQINDTHRINPPAHEEAVLPLRWNRETKRWPRTKDRVFIQTTTKNNIVTRKLKILANKTLPDVLNSGHRVEIHGWQKNDSAVGGRYELVAVEITL